MAVSNTVQATGTEEGLGLHPTVYGCDVPARNHFLFAR